MSNASNFATVICGAIALLASACSDDEAADTARDANGAPRATTSEEKRARWMQLGARTTPAQWLASADAAELKPANDPQVRKIAADLALAHHRYRESERMIANRAVQLQDMLREIGVAEPAVRILEDLAHVAGEAGQTEGFGAISQHYYNLRVGGASREAALAELQARYGPRS